MKRIVFILFFTNQVTGYSQLKDSFCINYGGDLRSQYFSVKNEGWGDAPKDNDGYILARFLVHADLQAGKYFRTFVQLQSSLSGSRISPNPVDENPLELHQVFADIKTIPTKAVSFTFRFGRQEFLYGSQRLISVREGPNNRQSFDAARSMLKAGNYNIDVFYGHHVAAKQGIFDDCFNKNKKLWGVYFVRNKLAVLGNIDFYYLGFWRRQALFDDGQGKELRHSIGTRVWKNELNWNYDLEGLYQFGKFSGKVISAWTASVNTSYRFTHAKWQPAIGLKTEFISGDHSYGDDKLQTFNPLFPRGAYFGLAALIGPANLIDVHPYLTLSLNKVLELGIDYDVFWRYSNYDGLYGVDGSPIYSGRNILSASIGGQPAFNFTYSPNNLLKITTEFTWFDAGIFLKAAGQGKDIFFTGLTIQSRL